MAALQDIQEAEWGSAIVHGYRQGLPHLILCGVLWAVGYGLTDLWPAYAAAIWEIVTAIGIAGGFVTLRVMRTSENRIEVWRYGTVVAIPCAFFFATFYVIALVNGRQVGAFIPLFIAAVYALASVGLGWRYAIAGIPLRSLRSRALRCSASTFRCGWRRSGRRCADPRRILAQAA